MFGSGLRHLFQRLGTEVERGQESYIDSYGQKHVDSSAKRGLFGGQEYLETALEYFQEESP
jgi:hypothetical protein